jgi:hypothetical protein
MIQSRSSRVSINLGVIHCTRKLCNCKYGIPMLPTDRVSTLLPYTKTRESGAVHRTDAWDRLEIWEMKQETNGLISLRSKTHGKTLESDSKGNVYVIDRFRESELWKLEYISERCDLHMKSTKHGRSLCCHDDSNLSKQY